MSFHNFHNFDIHNKLLVIDDEGTMLPVGDFVILVTRNPDYVER